MLNFNFPGLAQLIHLFAAFILFGAQFNLLLRFNNISSSIYRFNYLNNIFFIKFNTGFKGVLLILIILFFSY